MDIQYIKKMVPHLTRNESLSQSAMLTDYMDAPIHYTVDQKVQDSMALRGRDTGFEWVLPHQQMSIDINRRMRVGTPTFGGEPTKGDVVHLDTVWFGIVKNVVFPCPTGAWKLMIEDLGKKLLWLQSHATSLKHIMDSVPEHFHHLMMQYLKGGHHMVVEKMARSGLDIHKAYQNEPELVGALLFREVLRAKSSQIIHDAIRLHCHGNTETVDAFVYFVRYRTVSENRKWIEACNPNLIDGWEYCYDIEHRGTFFPIIHSLNMAYFDDGHTNLLHEFVVNMLKGLSSAWANQQISEGKTKITRTQRKLRKKSPNGIRIRSLKYDPTVGSIVSQKRESSEKSDEGHGWSQAGHERSSTHAFVWVLESNVKSGEVEWDIQERSNGSVWVKVMRPRKGYIVNGGSSETKVTLGHIKSI